MIPFNFVYLRPDSLEVAAALYHSLKAEGKQAMYYAGGSETITLCRVGSIQPDAVIDIKEILDCQVLSADDEELHIGAACTLSQIQESKLFPLLGLACGRIADHTNQCRITLGGNLCGTIIYRETSLPLLLSDAEITLFGSKGLRRVPFHEVFDGRLQLEAGEIIVQLHVPLWATEATYFHIKKTRSDKIDYPLVSVAGLVKDNQLRCGFAGICDAPFRSIQIEELLNDRTLSLEERSQRAVDLLPKPPHHDVEGSADYRAFVFKNTLYTLLEGWENGKV